MRELWSDLRYRWRALLHRDALGQELDAELDFHIQHQAEAYEREGLSREEAVRRARLAFGGMQQIREAIRDAQGTARFESLLLDTRYAWRRLRAQPGFSALAIATIAIGIGATTTVCSAVNGVLVRPLPYPNADRIVHVGEREVAHPGPGATTSYDNYADWQRLSHSFSAMGIVSTGAQTLTGRGEPLRVRITNVSSGVFDVFHVTPYLGRPILPADGDQGAAPVVLLGYDFWKSSFGGDSSVVGRTVLLNFAPAQIIGVLPRGFRGTGRMDRPVWSNFVNDTTDGRDGRSKDVYALLRPGVGTEQAQAELTRISGVLEREYPAADKGEVAVVDPLLDRIAGDVRRPLYLLLGASLLVLLIACANVSNLLLARGLARRQELAVRAALGAGRGRILRQLLTESALLAVTGAAIGVLLAQVAMAAITSLGPDVFEARPPALDWRVLAATALLSLGTALLFGLWPALRATRRDPQASIRASTARVVGGTGTARTFLAGAQLALAVVLLSVSALLLKSFARVLGVDPGVRPDHLLTMQITLPGPRYDSTRSTEFYAQLAERLQGMPSVRSAGITSLVPMSGDFDRIGIVDIAGRPRSSGSDEPRADRYVVSPSYFRTMGIQLERGRLLDAGDRYDAPLVCLVDAVFAQRVFGTGADALGQRMHLPTRQGYATVVGIVSHVKTYGQDVASPGQIYMSNAQFPWRWSSLVVRTTGDPLAFAPTATRLVHQLDPDQPVDNVASLDSLMDGLLRSRRFTLALLGGFAATALLLAVIGLYGVVAYGVAQRRREFGVRISLGAQSRQIARLVMGEGGRIASYGAAAGVLGALGATRFVGSLLFGVSPRDPTVLGGVVGVLIVVSFGAALIPAWRAMRVDATEVLRGE